MPWEFWAMVLAPFLDVLGLLELLEFDEEFFREAPLRTAGDGCATRGFKFFEVFLELGIGVFFMRAGAGSYCNADRAPPIWAVFSEEHAHHKIDLVCPVAASFNREGSQSAKFCREQEIGARTINEINKFGPISGQIAGKIAYERNALCVERTEGKAAYLARRNAILASSSVEFEVCDRFELELCPATGRLRPFDHGCRIRQRSVDQHRATRGRPEGAYGFSAVKHATQVEVFAKGNNKIGNSGPAVYFVIESPTLPAVVTAHTDGKRLSEDLMLPGEPASIRGLPGTLSGTRCT